MTAVIKDSHNSTEIIGYSNPHNKIGSLSYTKKIVTSRSTRSEAKRQIFDSPGTVLVDATIFQEIYNENYGSAYLLASLLASLTFGSPSFLLVVRNFRLLWSLYDRRCCFLVDVCICPALPAKHPNFFFKLPTCASWPTLLANMA